jgi:hypothetical protein
MTMRFAQAALAAVTVACLVFAAEAASSKKNTSVQVPPKSPEALYQYCRIAVFRKMGWHTGDGRLAMYPNTLVQQTDYCVSSGGKI